MTDRPDIQAQAMCRELRQEGYLVPYPVMVKAMQAAPLRPEAQGVKVRKLEWEDNGAAEYAICIVGEYRVAKTQNTRNDRYMVTYLTPDRKSCTLGYIDGLEQAKAAAQKHYEARILSALDRPEAQDGVAAAAERMVSDGRRWHLGTNSGNVFDPDEDFDGITLTIEVRGEEEARDIGFALCLIGSE